MMAGKIFYLSWTDLIVLKGSLCIFSCYFKWLPLLKLIIIRNLTENMTKNLYNYKNKKG